ncbi:cytochrome P450 10 isoform X2 [Patella vulgata]|uniref:cytochrome P450 10 isoform X2 n=1 Tax=Patella vulgata TaxID=6465 RepID=UPI00217FE8B1|nr:cytochrome P450 10 isoform X2 [Patella vulgata]
MKIDFLLSSTAMMNSFKLLRQYGQHNSMLLHKYNSTVAAAQLSDIKTSNPKPFKDIPGPTGIYNIPKIGAMFLFKPFSISVVCFDRRLGILSGVATEEVKNYLDNVKTFFVYVNKGRLGLPLYKYFETPMYKKFKKAADESYGFGRMQIEEALNKCLQMKKNGTWNPEEPNFLMSLLAAETLTIDQITGLVIDLLIAGTDSTAKNLENFLDCLARYPEVQETLYQEIIEHMGQNGDLTADNLPKMKYLVACLKESFRLHYPISFGTVRALPVDVVLSGYHVPKGTLIGLNNRRLLLDPKYVKDPTFYRPERWLRDEKGERVDPIPTVGLTPFGIGVRNCVGRRFAEQEIYLAIAKIVQNFKVSLTGEVPPPKIIYQTFGFLQQKSMFNFEKRK